jgi:peroxiredoxin Q/BCP
MMFAMTTRRTFLVVLGAVLLATGIALALAHKHAQAQEATLKQGDPAPQFTLGDQDGKTHSLVDYRGHWLVLYFYPKDDTPGCTTEACRFRDEYKLYLERGVDVLGVSIDSRESHERFAKKYDLPFPLLADTDGAVARDYGAYWSLGPLRFARRYTFLIDPHGRIARTYYKVRPRDHSAVLLKDLDHLRQHAQTN